jgi:Glyoxalase-like domain
MTRIRQAALAARDLEQTVGRLRGELGLGEPFADPAVAYFGLRNAVFAIGDTFIEVVSPAAPDTAAGRLLDRRGGDCGYMLMLQVDELAPARARARDLGVREVFEVDLDDIAEVHLHPADIGGAIVSLSSPDPAGSWRWGGPDWEERAVPGRIAGATVAVADPHAARERWTRVAGEVPGLEFAEDAEEPGLVAIAVEREGEVVTVTP